ncbi:ATP-dependent helicase [Blattabacterium cuenoti]|uniref:ATP-dependent helicase n=1 Tax=Blattabacterium cuenoti TaxID=1653831 RepID=UPI00163CD841|nr:UvrD-helicase domain-containing protein [Blattabacterium cuenoti]
MIKNDIIFSSLNSYQRKIIKTIHGPIVVIAAAGSGKTRVITHRIAHMIHNIGINPSNILALTFTNKAAKEMKNRISNMMDKIDFNKISLGTFHSIFSSILRKESHYLGYKSNYIIYDQKDSENVIKKILEDFNYKKTSFNPKKIRQIISQYKNNLKKKKFSNDIQNIYKCYIQRCFKAEALDFDDILLHTNYLFFHFPKILQKYQEKYKYILIDEYQDTNISQNNIIKNLSSKHRNVFVVGDDSQSIYAFRGANIANILNFHKDYKGAKIFRLEQNYRSTYHIVEASNNIISFNKNQLFKKVWTKNEKGEKIKIYLAYSEKEEARYIACSIISIQKNTKLKNKDFAILYRNNIQSHILEHALKEKKIPYKIYGYISFYQRKEIKDLLAYFRLINNPNDEESLLRIIKKKTTNKKIINLILNFSKKENKTIYHIFNYKKNYQKFLKKINKKTKNIFENLIITINDLRFKLKNTNIYIIAKKIINILEKKKKYYNYENFQYILNNISYYLDEQKKLKNNGNISLSGFLQFFSLKEEIDNEVPNNNKVSLMTIHLSKGLEFSVVFITGLEENLFPSKSSLENEFQLEEERRLFYVALTRAQKKAILTYTKYRFLWGKKIINTPSRFIQELNKKIIHKNKEKRISFPSQQDKFLNKGVKVFHSHFGIGTILNLQNQKKIAIIKFQTSGKKKILLKLAKLIIYS